MTSPTDASRAVFLTDECTACLLMMSLRDSKLAAVTGVPVMYKVLQDLLAQGNEALDDQFLERLKRDVQSKIRDYVDLTNPALRSVEALSGMLGLNGNDKIILIVDNQTPAEIPFLDMKAEIQRIIIEANKETHGMAIGIDPCAPLKK